MRIILRNKVKMIPLWLLDRVLVHHLQTRDSKSNVPFSLRKINGGADFVKTSKFYRVGYHYQITRSKDYCITFINVLYMF